MRSKTICLACLVIISSMMFASNENSAGGQSSFPKWLIWEMTDNDVWYVLDGIEYGAPQKWSICSTYLHFIGGDVSGNNWAYGLTFTLSPGTDGLRAGIGLSASGLGHGPIVVEIDLVGLRTWKDPLRAEADSNYIGIEAKVNLLLGVSVGYYRRIGHDGMNSDNSFWGIRYRAAFW